MALPAALFWKTTSPNTSAVPTAEPMFPGVPAATSRGTKVLPPPGVGALVMKRLSCAGSVKVMCQVTRYTPAEGRRNSVLLLCAEPGSLTVIPMGVIVARGKLIALPAAVLGIGPAEIAKVAG